MPKLTVHVDEDTRAVSGVLIDGDPADDVEVVQGKRRRPSASAVVLEFCPQPDAALERALEPCTRPRVLAALPWRHAAAPPGCAWAECT